MSQQAPGGPPPPPTWETPAPAPSTQPSRRFSPTTAIIVGLVVVVLVGAFFVITRTTERSAPTPEQVSAAFVPLEGYEYAEMPTESMEPLRQAFATAGADDKVQHFDARQVSSGGTPEAVVFILSVDPDDMEGDFEDQYIQGFTESSQATIEDLQLDDTTGHIAETPLGTIGFFFDLDGFAFNIVGRDRPTVESIARALEAGNS